MVRICLQGLVLELVLEVLDLDLVLLSDDSEFIVKLCQLLLECLDLLVIKLSLLFKVVNDVNLDGVVVGTCRPQHLGVLLKNLECRLQLLVHL